MLNPRAIAVQGIGYSTRLVALQGLVPIDDDKATAGMFWPLQRPALKKKRRDRDDDVLLFLLKRGPL